MLRKLLAIQQVRVSNWGRSIKYRIETSISDGSPRWTLEPSPHETSGTRTTPTTLDERPPDKWLRLSRLRAQLRSFSNLQQSTASMRMNRRLNLNCTALEDCLSRITEQFALLAHRRASAAFQQRRLCRLQCRGRRTPSMRFCRRHFWRHRIVRLAARFLRADVVG